ncbi:response regulator [bacterium]|nr:response regulator [bacterium]
MGLVINYLPTLIVDDNLKNIQVLGNTLRENDYEIAVATSGREALEWVESENYDIILLDKEKEKSDKLLLNILNENKRIRTDLQYSER